MEDKIPDITNLATNTTLNTKINEVNKNTLTGLENCKETTRHHAPYHYVQNQGEPMMQSQENGQKP